MKGGTPPPYTEVPVFSLFTEHIPMEEGTASPCTEAPVFSQLPNWNTPQRKKVPAPLPPVPKPPFFHTSPSGTHPNERRHPSFSRTHSNERRHCFPLYRSPCFFAPSKLEHSPMKKAPAPLPPLPKPPFFHTFLSGTHANERRHPSTDPPVFSHLPHWNTSQ